MAARKISSKQQPIRLFSLYAPRDALLYEEFEKHLSTLGHQELISPTSVGGISPGMNREAIIEKALREAQIVLCFLSSDFIASADYTLVKRAFQQQAETSKRFVPIKLRPVFIQDLPLAKLQVLPRDNRPVTKWPDKDEAFSGIVEELHIIIEEQLNFLAINFVITTDHLSYLHWLIERLSYLHVQGVHPHQSSFRIKIEEIYVPLQVEKEKDLSSRLTRDEEIQKQTESNPPLPFSEAALLHSHLLLLGEPGSGKTMCLHDLALRQAQQLYQKAEMIYDEIRLPILLRLIDFVEYGMHQGKSLSEYLAEDSIKYGCSVDQLADLLRTALQSGKCLVLLDGLDEVAGTEDRLAVVQQIETFVNQYKHVSNSIIITSRLVTYGTGPFSDTFARYRLCKLDEAHLLAFLQAWYPTLQAASPPKQRTNRGLVQEKPTIDSIHGAIQTVPALLQLAENPLFLRILMQLYEADVPLPQQRITLYTQMTRMLLQAERLFPGASRGALAKVFWQLSQSSITHLLRRLGFWLHTNKPGGIMREDEIFGEWRNIWPTLTNQQQPEENLQLEQEMRYLLRTITDQTGILVEETRDHYRFVHLTFEEYFAACSLVTEITERATSIRNHLHEAHWQEPILLALGLIGMEAPKETHLLVESVLLAEGKEAKARGITPSPYEALLGRDFLFALRCLENDIPVQPTLAEYLIGRLYRELTYNSGSGRFSPYQHALIERLVCLETSRYAPVLLALCLKSLENPDDPARLWSVYRLIEIACSSLPEKEQVSQRLQTMLSDQNPWIRSACLKGLHDLGYPGLRDILLDRLQNEDDRAVQEKALHYLNEMGERSAHLTETLLSVLQQTTSNPGNFQFQRSVVAALGESGDASPAVISALIALLPSDMTSFLDTHVLASLRQLSYQSSEVIPMLVSALKNASQSAHPVIAHEMTTFAQTTPQAKEAFLIYTLRAWNPSLRVYAAQELKQLEEISEQAEETLQSYLSDKERDVRLLTVEILCTFELSAKTFGMLSDILSRDADVFLQTHIMQCLVYADWPTKDLLQVLFQATRDPEDRIRSCALENLGKLAPTSSQVLNALLLALSHDPSDSVRWSVIRYFQELNMVPKKALPVLVQALADENLNIRHDCAQLLGQQGAGNPQTIQALIKGLSDNDGFVRQACSQALVLLGQRYPQRKPTIMKQLEQCIQEQQDDSIRYLNPADMAFQALWLLSTDSSVGEEL
jgi:HEAT repeat protein